MKVIMDALVSCCHINYLTCIDDYTDASRTITVALRICVQATYIVRGYLATTRTAQRRHLPARLLKHNVEPRLVQPGQPKQNGSNVSPMKDSEMSA